MEKIKYDEKIVAYFDILGFKEKIKVCSADEIHKILQWPKDYFYKKKAELEEEYFQNIEYTFFSDSIVLSVPSDPEKLLTPNGIEFILEIIIGWLNMGVLCRGGVTRGEVYHKGDEIFGPAMNETVDLEKNAIFPRVVLKDNIFNKAREGKKVDGAKKKENNYTKSFLKKDADGFGFIDYFSTSMFLNVSHINKMQYPTEERSQLCYLNNLSEIIKKGLKSNSPHVIDKYLWCLAKHRVFLNELINAANKESSLKSCCNIKFSTDDIYKLSLQFYNDTFAILLNSLKTIRFDSNECSICLNMHQQFKKIERWLLANDTKGPHSGAYLPGSQG